MKIKPLAVVLGIVTSVGGYLDIGSIMTSAQAGAIFGYQLLWTLAVAAIVVIFLVEMSGRFAAVSKHTIADGIRERFGFNFFIIPLLALTIVNLMILASEIGGMCIALELATGVPLRLWSIPVGLFLWLFLWKGNFDLVENGGAILGLVTVCFLVGIYVVHPSWHDIGRSLLPSPPVVDKAKYWFLAVSIMGASVSPYLFIFYSSGAIEDKWKEEDLPTNKMVAVVGMGFGTIIAMAVLLLAGYVLQPRGIRLDHYSQFGAMLTPIFGHWGFWLLAASLFVACMGASLEIGLELSYFICQGFGWGWGENKKPKDAPRFSILYTIAIALGTVIILLGINPLKLTMVSMALVSATLPLAVFPFLVLMNDRAYMGKHTNGLISNVVVIVAVLLASVLSVITIPLEFLGGG